MIKLQNISANWARLWRLLDPKSRAKYSLVIALSVIVALLEIAGLGILLHTVLSILNPDFIQENEVINYLYELFQTKSEQKFILIITVLLFASYVLKNTVLVQINKWQVQLAFDISTLLADKHYTFLTRNELLYFSHRKSADIINEVIAISLSFTEGVLLSSVVVFAELFMIVFMLIGILIYQPALFLFTLVSIVPIAAILIYSNRKALTLQGQQLRDLYTRLFQNISEFTYGITQIKLGNSAHYSLNEHSKIREEMYAYKKSIYIRSTHVPPRVYEVMAIAGILCVVLYGVYGQLGSGAMISATSIYAGVSFRLLPSMNRVIVSSNTLSTNTYILDYLERSGQFATEDTKFSKVELQRSIRLNTVSFGYTTDNEIISKLDLTIHKGDFIGFIGQSGEGKSTLVNLICSLITPTSGSISLDDKLVSSENLKGYRHLFSYVKQEVFMLDESVLHNVAFFDENPDEQRVLECLKKVNLGEWIDHLPDGIHTHVGEVGKQVSGGQRQRIAIARALYNNAEIFIFDEVTNNLDTESKEQTLNVISTLKEQGKTAIFITHKEDELELCDKVYSLHDKQLSEVQ